MRRSLIRPLPPGCILDDVWLPMQAVMAGYRAILAEDAIAWDHPTSLAAEFSRKVRTQAGLYQLLRLEPRLLNPVRNRLFSVFVNLKLGRLFLGHFMIAAAASSFWLPTPFATVAVAIQSIFYGLFALDAMLPKRAVIKKYTSPVAAVVTLVAAAFWAQTIFFRDSAALWKATGARVLRDSQP